MSPCTQEGLILALQVTAREPCRSSRGESSCLQVKKPEDTQNNSVVQKQVREWHRDLHSHFTAAEDHCSQGSAAPAAQEHDQP